DDYLLATGSTCVLLADGRVKNLTAVKAGDSLQRASGGSVEVLAVNVGEFRKGVHGIAVTENAPVGSGHMFAVNGVVVPEFLWSGEVTE
ncbi:MAG: hypothetical protein KDD62_15905, partial [Bdellovibrionales bacterium]|nr:hypothetical protein [Bdellovibrionales bacterium]